MLPYNRGHQSWRSARVKDEASDSPIRLPAPSERDGSRMKRARISRQSRSLSIAAQPRQIMSPDDLDDGEIQRCNAILHAGVHSMSPEFLPTAAMLEVLLTAVFDGWNTNDTVATVEPCTAMPAEIKFHPRYWQAPTKDSTCDVNVVIVNPDGHLKHPPSVCHMY